MKRTGRVTAWSYSRLRAWEECPAKCYFKNVAKLKEPGSAAMERGDKMHKDIEAYCRGEKKLLMKENKPAKKLIDPVRAAFAAHRAKLEYQIAFDAKWNLVSWFAPEAWLRVMADAMVIGDAIEVIDWKSGKFKEHGEYDEQLDLYGASALLAGFGKEAVGKLVFLDHAKVVQTGGDEPTVITLKDVPRFKKEWTARVTPMLNDKRFDPKPGRGCSWCHFRKSNGGPCEY